jgi:hypothetical protein
MFTIIKTFDVLYKINMCSVDVIILKNAIISILWLILLFKCILL